MLSSIITIIITTIVATGVIFLVSATYREARAYAEAHK